ncbi:hypothetical protein [Streptomyces sp. NPDC048639]|uniref:hypothetical protein n=1 Tax=Streptomyces sp. NPDC048639 TaxID=3365581 RepID=UPI0037173944
MTTALLCWWRELEIHTADALIGHAPRDWSRPFCAHLLEFLAPRARGRGLTLVATDGSEVHVAGSGPDPVTVRGALSDLTAWRPGASPKAPSTAILRPLRNSPPGRDPGP